MWFSVGYRMGGNSAGTMLGVWQQTEDLEARRVEVAIEQRRVVAELAQMVATGDETVGD